MRVYISGPITGTDDYMERFAKVEEKLKKAGHSVMNPAKLNSVMPEDTTYEEYMRMSFAMLDMCGAIYMMDGKNHAARIENMGMRWGAIILFLTIRNCWRYVNDA